MIEETNVPITIEFLEANGFTISHANHHVWEIEAHCPYFSVEKSIGEETFNVNFYRGCVDVDLPNFRYEHEILSLLKLCTL